MSRKMFECKEIFICLLSWYSPTRCDPGSTVRGLGRADAGPDPPPPPLKHKMRNENCSKCKMYSWQFQFTGEFRNIFLAPTWCHYCSLLPHPSIFFLEGEFWVEDHAQTLPDFPSRNCLISPVLPRAYFWPLLHFFENLPIFYPNFHPFSANLNFSVTN